jgi:hypothetical protein
VNEAASTHCRKAKEYVGRGEEYYRKAAAEMRAAKDAGATWTEIADAIGRSDRWCERIVAWAESPGNTATDTSPWSEDTPRRQRDMARQVLREAPVEQIEQIMSDLPPERRAAVSRALAETHPATVTRPPLGVRDRIRDMERNTSLVILLAGPLSRLIAAAQELRGEWDRHADGADEEEREVIQQQINDAVATLLAINSDPQELLT